MKYLFRLAILLSLLIAITGCGTSTPASSFIVAELSYPEEYEKISNDIPRWVFANECDNTPLYVATAENMNDMMAYAIQEFPSLCDSHWTQEQSDDVYLGQGIQCYVLDDSEVHYSITTVTYFPIIYNGTIISMMMVYETSDKGGFAIQLAPYFVNEINILAKMTSENTPLYIGLNQGNIIGIIENTVYLLQPDYGTWREINTEIINLNKLTNVKVVSAKDVLTDERTADVSDWNVIK